MKRTILMTDSRNLPATIGRLALSIVLFPHGAQKLLAWFGGYGFTGTMNFFTEVKGIPYLIGVLVIIIEFFGPLFLITGLLTRLWALGIVLNMIGIIVSSHKQFGFFMNWFGNQAGEGYEYHLLAIGLALVLLLTGGGRFSADSALVSRK